MNESNDMNSISLDRIHETQVEILSVIDRICREHGIRYSLFAGTALGAIRHRGFIPWDDDLDICMKREEYERFLHIWNAAPVEGYLLQNKENTPTFTQSFSKIRKDHTAFVQFEWEKGRYHTGIFVDIFPIDRIPNGSIRRTLFKLNCMRYQLLTREFLPERAGGVVRAASACLLALTPKSRRPKVRKNLERRITRFDGKTAYACLGVETMHSLHYIYDPDMYEEYVETEFEGRTFMMIRNYRKCLTTIYGDYMQLPPEADRVWKHHPIVLDFGRNYEEIPEDER